MNLRPGARVLLSETHASVDAHHEFGQMLGESLGNHLAQFVVFVTAEETQPAPAFFALANESRGIDTHLPIANALPVAEGNESLVAIGRCRSVAVLTKPSLQLLRSHICCVARAEI